MFELSLIHFHFWSAKLLFSAFCVSLFSMFFSRLVSHRRMNGSVYPLRAPRGMRWCHWVNCHSPIEASLFNNSITHNDSSKYRHSKNYKKPKTFYESKFISARVWRTLRSTLFRESSKIFASISGVRQSLIFLRGELRTERLTKKVIIMLWKLFPQLR